MAKPAASATPPVGRDRAFDSMEAAFALMARKAGLPRIHDRMSAATGVMLDPSSFHLIRRLSDSGPIRASELASLLCLDLSTVSRLVAGVEALGLVERHQDPLDGRASLLSLSEPGMLVSERLSEARREMFAEMLADWPLEDVEQFATLLASFARAMDGLAGEHTRRPERVAPTESAPRHRSRTNVKEHA